MRGETNPGLRGTARTVLGAVLGIFLATVAGASDQGIRGRASLLGVLNEGVVVTAYPYRAGAFGPLTGEAPAGSAITGTDGSYRLALPPGRYVVEGLGKAPGNADRRPQAGDLYCLYSGSPVTVAASRWTPVGLNLVTVPREQRQTGGERTVIRGRITYREELQEKVYLYLYQDAASGFRGPARLLQPVATGEFRLRVPPGTYQLVARKRFQGGAYGPIEIGDLFNFYPMNPVTVAAGEEVELEIPLVARLSQLEEEAEDNRSLTGLKIRVLDTAGAPAQGYYVLVYGSAARSGPPLATSPATDGDGRTHLPLPSGDHLFLRARATVGGPLADGQPYADAQLSSSTEANSPELVLRLSGTE